jgi:hypothetical protein
MFTDKPSRLLPAQYGLPLANRTVVHTTREMPSWCHVLKWIYYEEDLSVSAFTTLDLVDCPQHTLCGSQTVTNGIKKKQNFMSGFTFYMSVTMIQAFYSYIILEEHLSWRWRQPLAPKRRYYVLQCRTSHRKGQLFLHAMKFKSVVVSYDYGYFRICVPVGTFIEDFTNFFGTGRKKPKLPAGNNQTTECLQCECSFCLYH